MTIFIDEYIITEKVNQNTKSEIGWTYSVVPFLEKKM